MNTPKLTQLDNLGLIKISGEDAASFLQGQLTNDVTLLENQWQFSGYCNPKGRLLALLRLCKQADDFYALIPSELIVPISQRLRMYVMRSKVVIEEVEFACVLGFQEISALREIDPLLAEQTDQAVPGSTLSQARGFALIAERASIYIGLDPLNIETSDDYDWQLENISAGIPEITAATSELFVPQMVNLDLLNGINFKKGCYTGQEIVARMHYLGKLKQRMFLCEVSGDFKTAAQPADKLFADSDSSKNTGTLVCISNSGNRALGVLRLSDADGSHYLANGQVLKPLAKQPVRFPEQES